MSFYIIVKVETLPALREVRTTLHGLSAPVADLVLSDERRTDFYGFDVTQETREVGRIFARLMGRAKEMARPRRCHVGDGC